jgi:lysophospholipase L1-like esterase
LKNFEEKKSMTEMSVTRRTVRTAAVVTATAAATVAITDSLLALLEAWRRKEETPEEQAARAAAAEPNHCIAPLPVLCFGDSLTEGYCGVWRHPRYSPESNPDDPQQETAAMRLHPYCLKLGDLLADAAGDHTPQRRARFAVHRAWNGWTAEQLLPMLQRELRAGPWRCVVVLAGSNDVCGGAAAEVVLRRLRALWEACDSAGVRVVVVPTPPAALKYHGWVNPPGDAAGEAKAAERTAALAALGELVAAAAAAEGRPVTPILRQGDDLCTDHDWLWDDCLHLSPRGSDKLGELVFDAITAAGL